MILEDLTYGEHLSLSESGQLLTTAGIAAALGVPVGRLRPLLRGLEPVAHRVRGGGAPPERLWAAALVVELRTDLPAASRTRRRTP